MPAKKPSAKAAKPKKTVSAPVKMSSPRSASRAVKARPAAPRKPTVRATPARPAPRPVRVVPPTVAAKPANPVLPTVDGIATLSRTHVVLPSAAVVGTVLKTR